MSRHVLLCIAILLIGAWAVQGAQLSDDQHRSTTDEDLLHKSSTTGPHDKLVWSVRTVAALAITIINALLANAAGVGGGPVYLPTLMIIAGFELTPATALSHTIVSVSAIASSLYGFCARSPNAPDRSLIDWDLTIFIPALLVGVSVGVMFNVIFPRWLQTILLTILLVIVFIKTLGKGRKMWASERKDDGLKKRQAQNSSTAHHQEETDDDEEGVLHEESYHLKPHKLTRQSMSRQLDAENGEEDGRLAQITDTVTDGLQVAKSGVRGCLGRQPYFKILSVVVLWVIFLVFQQTKSRYNRCSGQYIGLFVGEVVLFAAFAVLGIYLVARQAENHPDDVDPELRDALLGGSSGAEGSSSKRTLQKLLVVAAVMAASGLMAGLLGIGGALIFNPFLLALGVHPQVTASTSVLLILFSSSAICISLGFQGFLNASYAVVFAPCAFAASIIGVTVVGRYIKKTGHASIIIFILTTLIGIGAVLTAVFGGWRNVQEIRDGGGFGFKPFCTKE